MKKNKGFTLIELLAVIVIIAIVSLISIPIYRNLSTSNRDTTYNNYLKLVKNAASLYMEGYSSSISSEYSCFRINYDALLKEGLLNEDSLTCEGSIVGNRENNGFNYSYYLTCKDRNGNVINQNNETYNNNCIGINKKYTTSVVLKYDNVSGTNYNGEKNNWTSHSIYQEFSNNNAFYSNLKTYQISDNGGEYVDVSGNMTTSTDGNIYRCLRAIDNDNNISSESCYYIAIDKTAPECYVKGNDTWTVNPITVELSCKDNLSGCTSSSTNTKQFISTINNYNYDAYQISDNAGNTRTCDASSVSVKIDNDKPTCTVTKSNTGSTTGVNTSVLCDDNGSGVSTCPSADTNLTSSKTYTVTDNVGNTNTCSVSVSAVTKTSTRTCNLYRDSCTTTSTPQVCQPRQCIPGTSYSWTIYYCNDGSSQGSAANCNLYGGGYTGRSTVASTCTLAPAVCTGGGTTTSCTGRKESNGCETWGGWSEWSTDSCSPSGNYRQCQSSTVYE